MTKLNYIANHFAKITAVFTLLGLLIVSSCKDDGGEKSIQIATVQFATSAQTVSENGAVLTVTINLDKEAGKDGTITIGLAGTAEYTTNYTTNPAGTTGTFNVSVSEGQTVAQFTLTPVNNALLQDDKTVELSIIDVSDAFEIGSQASNVISIIDDEGPTQANFSAASSSTVEDVTAGIDVTINLSSPAPGTGTVTVSYTSATAVYTTNFTTEPAATTNQVVVPVAVSATSITFKVKPVDDANVNAPRVIVFTIASADGAVVAGTAITEHTVTITDNETPSTATFTNTSGSIEEAVSAGITIPVTLDPQTNGAGTIAVTLASPTAVYGTDYTTDPAAVAGVVTVNVAASATSASFKVIPMDNGAVAADKTLTLTMTSSTGVVVVGASNNVYTLTVEDDDAITTIADVRAMYSGSDVSLGSGVNVQGVVISDDDNYTNRNLFIQDATGSIVLRFASLHSFVRGDEIKVKVSGGLLTRDAGSGNTGPLQLGGTSGLTNANATKIGDGLIPAVVAVSIDDLNSGNYEGQYVSITNAAFADANGVLTLNGGRTVSNGTSSTVVRTESFAPWTSTVMPYGFGELKGIASVFNGVEQLIPQAVGDIHTATATGTLNVTQTLTNFGSVNNGAESSIQSYTIQGTGLAGNVVITASANFKISYNSSPYASSVTIDAANANNLNTIDVKFIPTTGVNQDIAGTLTQKPLGAAPQSFAVNGTESGNAATPQLVVDNFDYGASDNSDITTITSNWTRHSGAQGPQYVASGLSYSGYIGSSIGGALSFTKGGSGVTDGDVNRKFTTVNTTGNVYAAFLVNVSAAQATADYFFHFGPNTISTTFRGRVFARSNGSGWSFGLAKNNDTRVDDNTVLNFNQTYLVVVKYLFSTGTASDDQVALYVYASGVPTAEPDSPTITISPTGATTGTSDPSDIGSIAVRQGSNTPTALIDGIRVAKTWSDLFN